jgi:hypothetical protein
MGDNHRRRRRCPPLAGERGEDRISALPDELLHRMLLCLRSARAATRTSVLSRRWCRVWTELPELFLSSNKRLASSILDEVDAALAAYAAPTLGHLSINMQRPRGHVPANRVAPWLRFASRRVVGRLSIHVPADRMTAGEEAEELELLAWGAATAIWLSLERSWRLRVAGVFAALTELHICCGRMEGGDISALVPAPEKAGTSRQVGCCVRRLHTLRLAAHIEFVCPQHTAARGRRPGTGGPVSILLQKSPGLSYLCSEAC